MEMKRMTKRISKDCIELSAECNPSQYAGCSQKVYASHPFWNVFLELCKKEDAEEETSIDSELDREIKEQIALRLEAKKAKLVQRSTDSTDVNEVRSINEELEDVNAEIEEAKGEIKAIEEEEAARANDPATTPVEGRSQVPANATLVNPTTGGPLLPGKGGCRPERTAHGFHDAPGQQGQRPGGHPHGLCIRYSGGDRGSENRGIWT